MYTFLFPRWSQVPTVFRSLADWCFSITFADGTGASGIVYTDTVTVGGSTVTGQIVEFANTVSGFNEAGDSEDGIFGLAFDNINTGMCIRLVVLEYRACRNTYGSPLPQYAPDRHRHSSAPLSNKDFPLLSSQRC